MKVVSERYFRLEWFPFFRKGWSGVCSSKGDDQEEVPLLSWLPLRYFRVISLRKAPETKRTIRPDPGLERTLSRHIFDLIGQPRGQKTGTRPRVWNASAIFFNPGKRKEAISTTSVPPLFGQMLVSVLLYPTVTVT